MSNDYEQQGERYILNIIERRSGFCKQIETGKRKRKKF